MTVLRVIDGRELNTEERLQLLEQVGNFSITPASVLRRILKELKIKYEPKNKQTPQKDNTEDKNELSKKEVVIG